MRLLLQAGVEGSISNVQGYVSKREGGSDSMEARDAMQASFGPSSDSLAQPPARITAVLHKAEQAQKGPPVRSVKVYVERIKICNRSEAGNLIVKGLAAGAGVGRHVGSAAADSDCETPKVGTRIQYLDGCSQPADEMKLRWKAWPRWLRVEKRRVPGWAPTNALFFVCRIMRVHARTRPHCSSHSWGERLHLASAIRKRAEVQVPTEKWPKGCTWPMRLNTGARRCTHVDAETILHRLRWKTRGKSRRIWQAYSRIFPDRASTTAGCWRSAAGRSDYPAFLASAVSALTPSFIDRIIASTPILIFSVLATHHSSSPCPKVARFPRRSSSFSSSRPSRLELPSCQHPSSCLQDAPPILRRRPNLQASASTFKAFRPRPSREGSAGASGSRLQRRRSSRSTTRARCRRSTALLPVSSLPIPSTRPTSRC